MDMLNKQFISHSFIPTLPNVEDFEFGAKTKIKGEVLQASGDWENELSVHEMQVKRFLDSYGCVSFCSLNCYETIHILKFGFEENWSDRATIVASGTVPYKGNSLRNVVESIRKDGVIPEEEYPFSNEIKVNEFFAKLPDEIKAKMSSSLSFYKFGYEWVDKSLARPMDRDKLCEALKYSPLITAVDSGSPSSAGLIRNKLRGYDHSELIFKYKYKEYFLTYNSYQHKIKKYSWDYNFFPPIVGYLDKIKDRDITSAKIPGFKVRERKSGKVFYINGDNERIYVPNKKIYCDIFGENDWLNWVDISEKELLKYPDSGSIDNRLNEVVDFLKEKDIIKKD